VGSQVLVACGVRKPGPEAVTCGSSQRVCGAKTPNTPAELGVHRAIKQPCGTR
jgi:hypothetical protein